ncbi:hypothetical protein [Salinarimonas sp. NSM]|uniref:hypothetical protein n=1 Tax=Salinarimonas sp. NSM TaxID=3458003 RepID=UPI004036D314
MPRRTEAFSSPKILLERARSLIRDLEALLRRHFDQSAFENIVEIGDLGQQIHKLKLIRGVPDEAKTVLKDCISNLRDALDHAVYASAVALGRKDPEDTAFPFAATHADLLGKLRSKKFKDIPDVIQQIIIELKPYVGGNDLLVGLNRIRNPSTHMSLLRPLIDVPGINMNIKKLSANPPSTFGYTEWDCVRNEIILMEIGMGSIAEYEVSAPVNIVFTDTKSFNGEPIIEKILEVANEVERVIAMIEFQTRVQLRLLSSSP